MSKILIVEDDDFLREILTDYLTGKGHEIASVPNGKVAKDVVRNGTFDLIISDVQMPFFNGVEFLQWLRPQSQVPFILMTGFTNLLETQKAAELGAQGFLSKPFTNQELLKLVNEILVPKVVVEPTPQNLDAEYCKVPIDEFVARPKIEYDIYIRLQSHRYLKVAHTGDLLDIQRLRNYREKGISHLHIKKEDFQKLVNFNVQVSKALQASDSISEEKKLRFMRYTGEIILEKCYVDGVDKVAFEEAKTFFMNSMGVAANNSEMFGMMEILNSHSDYLYAHCLGVAIYSVMIAKELKFESPQVHFKLAMAGLFHDIGKKEIPREILDKSRILLTAAERQLIESHVQRGREIMQSIPNVPADVIQIINEHHEDELGQGYPNATPQSRLHPLSRIVHVADQFISRAIHSPAFPDASAESAITHLLQFYADSLDKNAFHALKKLVPITKAA